MSSSGRRFRSADAILRTANLFPPGQTFSLRELQQRMEERMSITALQEMLSRHSINTATRLACEQWMKEPLFVRVALRRYRRLTPEERGLVLQMIARKDPHILVPEYDAEALLRCPEQHPAPFWVERVNGPIPGRRALHEVVTEAALEFEGVTFSVDELHRRAVTLPGGEFLSRRSVRYKLDLHTINTPRRLTTRMLRWRDDPRFMRVAMGRFRTLSEPERKRFLNLARADHPRIDEPDYDAEALLQCEPGSQAGCPRAG